MNTSLTHGNSCTARPTPVSRIMTTVTPPSDYSHNHYAVCGRQRDGPEAFFRTQPQQRTASAQQTKHDTQTAGLTCFGDHWHQIGINSLAAA